VLKQDAAIAVVKDLLWPGYARERDRLDVLDRWYRHDPDRITLPRRSTREHKMLADLARTPWLGLVVSVLSQSTLVDGYRSPEQSENAGPWRTWEGNDFDARQVPIHRAAYAYGYAYNLILPGVAPDGTSMAAMRGKSPRKFFAVYAEPAEDDWPMYAMGVERQPGGKCAIRLYDEVAAYFLSSDDNGSKVEFIEWREHAAGVCPVAKYSNMLDLEGRSTGEVEPFIPTAARINKTDFDRLLAQHFNSWKIRTVAGMAKPDKDEDAAALKLLLRQEDILTAEDADTKFGTLDETPLDGFIKAHDSDVETLAAVSQTPTNALTGQMINMSAEALAAARAQLDQKVGERKTAFGKAHAQSLRLAAHLEGNESAAQDITARVTWQDTSIRSIATAADALGKIATMLGVPVQALWGRIPGVSKSDVDEWKSLAASGDALTNLGDLLERQAAGLTATPARPRSATTDQITATFRRQMQAVSVDTIRQTVALWRLIDPAAVDKAWPTMSRALAEWSPGTTPRRPPWRWPTSSSTHRGWRRRRSPTHRPPVSLEQISTALLVTGPVA
jgi:hypothetical protein